MNICIVHHYSISFNRGGERMLRSIASELKRKGHSVFVYSLPLNRRGKVSLSFYYEETFFKRLDCDVSYFFYAPLLHKLFQVSAPRIAGIHSFVVYPSFSHEKTSFPHLLYRHGILASGAIYFNRLTGNRDLNSFNAVHFPNIYMPIPISIPVYNIPNWVDLQVFKPRRAKNDVFTVLFVGSGWSKGYDIFYSIAKYFSKKGLRIKFLAVGAHGEGKPRSFIEMHPIIYQEDLLADIYSSSHVLIHPSRADVFGVTLIESLACGTPILTSALPSHQVFLPPFFHLLHST